MEHRIGHADDAVENHGVPEALSPGDAAPSLSHASLEVTYADLYDEARRLARRLLRGGGAPWHSGATMNTTALVNEAYLRLHRRDGLRWNDQGHFMALVARAMRFILVDYARARLRVKRGGGVLPETLTDAVLITPQVSEEILQLDRALARLTARSARAASVVECRFIVGLSIEETALTLGVSTMTVKRDWVAAKAFLARELRGSAADGIQV